MSENDGDERKMARARSIVEDDTYKRTRQRAISVQFAQTATGYAYNPAAAYISAVASAWAYSDAETLLAQLMDVMEVPLVGSTFRACNPAMYLDTNAFFIRTTEPDYRQRLGILVYRGTDLTSVGDFLADVNVETYPFPSQYDHHGNVHGGFITGIEAVWKRVYSMLVADGEPGANGEQRSEPAGDAGIHSERVGQLIITGHSLGAAMAVLTAAQIVKEAEAQKDRRFMAVRESLRGVYTFGQPAVGDAGFASWVKEKHLGSIIFRHAYGRDLVPFIPTLDLSGGFQHFSSPVYLARKEAPIWSGPNFDRSFSVERYFIATLAKGFVDFVIRRMPVNIPLAHQLLARLINMSFDDHSPANYLRASKQSYWSTHAQEDAFEHKPENGRASAAAN